MIGSKVTAFLFFISPTYKSQIDKLEKGKVEKRHWSQKLQYLLRNG